MKPMKSGYMSRFSCCAAVLFSCALIVDNVWAGDIKEARRAEPPECKPESQDAPQSTVCEPAKIFYRLWKQSAMPLVWHLNEAGVVDNNNILPSNRIDILEETLQKAFSKWAAIETAKISVEYGGRTATSRTACDFQNVVTWADDTAFIGKEKAVARGITWFYAGETILELNDDNRRGLLCGSGQSFRDKFFRVDLPYTYENGTTLKTGTILDADMVWNSAYYDFSIEPNDNEGVHDIESLAVHEFGHMLGLTHTSMNNPIRQPTGANTPTMFVAPAASENSTYANNIRSLEADDIAAASRAYPGKGFYPGGTEPYKTGGIKGQVTLDGAAVEGARLWLFRTDDPRYPVYETFSAASLDRELSAGQYEFKGIPAGTYHVCVLPWLNNVPEGGAGADKPTESNYNWTVGMNSKNITEPLIFQTECHNRVRAWGIGRPRVTALERVMVEAGKTGPAIDFELARPPQ